MSTSQSVDNATRNIRGQNLSKPRRTPLPKLQLFIVFLIQFSEPITATVIYPFINKFVRDIGVTGGDERKTGYYAGVIESSFFFAEALTVFLWGRASDKYGRRPILLLGPLGLSLAVLAFGVSTRFWALVASRFMQGVFNGNIGVSKSMIGELTDSTNIADAIAIIPVVWATGTFVAPILGGLLSQPAEAWPDFFHRHPYFLPCAVASSISIISAFIAFLGLRETLPSVLSKEKRNRVASNLNPDSTTNLLATAPASNYGSSTRSGPEAEAVRDDMDITTDTAPPLASLFGPKVVLILSAYAFYSLVDMSCQVLQPLVYSTSPSLGGLGFDPYHIGMIMGTWGIVNAFIQLNCLARGIRHFGPRKTFIFSLSSYVVVLSLYPLLGFLSKRNGRADGIVWTVMYIQLFFTIPVTAGYASIHMMIVEVAPNNASLGALNGMAQAVACSMRSVGPSMASSLFSISLERQLAGGNMTYLILIGFALTGIRYGFLLPDTSRKSATH